jgi:cysteine desulfurase
MQEIYLDNSATTRPLSEVITAMVDSMETNYGNPSSLHNKGLRAERIIKRARNKILKKINNPSKGEVVFTSGGTESNNLAIKGIAEGYQNRGNHLITTEVEHSSVLNVFKYLEKNGYEVTYLPVNSEGLISLNKLRQALKEDTILVSIMHINNELGSIQPIKKAASIIKEKNKKTFFHVDGIQAFGKIDINPEKMGVDLYSISSHKFHGPKGIGALYLKKGIDLSPLLHGGGQENNLRSGTENIPGIAGLIPALDSLPELNHQTNSVSPTLELRDYFIEHLQNNSEKLPNFKINTPLFSDNAAPHIINISFPGLRGEVIVHSLEGEGIYISTGSACHSKKNDKSSVLEAINLSDKYLQGTVRFSFSRFNTRKEIDFAINILIEKLNFLSS